MVSDMNKKRIFWGIMLLIAAAFLIVGKLGFLGSINYFSLFFTIILIVIILKSIPHMVFSGILFPVAFLCIIYDRQLHIEVLTPWTVLAVAALGSIGLHMIFHNHTYSHKAIEDYDHEIVDIPDESHISIVSQFGSTAKYINTDDFKQADLNCSLGELSVYFENAAIPSGNAVARIKASFCGIELYVPKEWRIVNDIHCFFSAVEEKGHACPDQKTTLHLIGDASFCGVEIFYV